MTLQIPFSLPPDNLELASDEVYVFCAQLEQPVTRLEQFRETMSPDELQRAARFRFEKDRNFFVAGRGMLRKILGWLLDMKPSELSFSYGNHGKHRLATAASKNFLHFNVAHSDSLVVYAVARDREVGVDVECNAPCFACRSTRSNSTAICIAELRSVLFVERFSCRPSRSEKQAVQYLDFFRFTMLAMQVRIKMTRNTIF